MLLLGASPNQDLRFLARSSSGFRGKSDWKAWLALFRPPLGPRRSLIVRVRTCPLESWCAFVNATQRDLNISMYNNKACIKDEGAAAAARLEGLIPSYRCLCCLRAFLEFKAWAHEQLSSHSIKNKKIQGEGITLFHLGPSVPINTTTTKSCLTTLLQTS